jgi:hypothetical protein
VINPFKALKSVWTPKAGWIESVSSSGQPAVATVLAEPDAVIEMRKGGGYGGHDPWIDVDVRVEASTQPPFEGKAKCTLATAMGGLIGAGTKVDVRYDPADVGHIVIVDDMNTLLQRRVAGP